MRFELLVSVLAADQVEKPASRMFWLLMQERVGSTWFASTHLQQHPDILMLKGGQGEACFGLRFRLPQHTLRRAEDRCFAQLLAHRAECNKRGVRVCGWKARADFCPTERCRTWIWTKMRPQVLHLYRRDAVQQAMSHAIASITKVWTCKPGSRAQACTSPPLPTLSVVERHLAWMQV